MTPRHVTARRHVARLITTVVGALVGLAVLPSCRRLSAQVGHDPARSPYRDIRRGSVFLLSAGYLGGSRGAVGVGLADGPSGGLRYEAALGGAIGASLGLAYAQATRFVVDPTKDSLTRKAGPYDADLILVDAGLLLVLTGRKTWHNLAPYIGGSLGMAVAGASPPDPSGYDFGSKITLAPDAGIRWYPAPRLSVRTDFRVVLWRLSYPASYKVPGPTGCTTDCSRVLELDQKLTDWTAHPWITVGMGWTF